MKKVYLSLITILLFLMTVFSLSKIYFKHNEILEYLNNSTELAIEEISLNKMINNPKVNLTDNTIEIQVDLNQRFESESLLIQFTSFEFFTKHLRFFLYTKSNKNKLETYDIVLTANINESSFIYKSQLLNNRLIFKSTSYLSKNQNIIYSSSEMKKNEKEIAKYFPQKDINEHNDYEIFQYGENFFAILTTNGKYYNPDVDNQLVNKAVMEKFNITYDELINIYKKYYLLI